MWRMSNAQAMIFAAVIVIAVAVALMLLVGLLTATGGSGERLRPFNIG